MRQSAPITRHIKRKDRLAESLELALSKGNGVPLFRQLYEQIVERIAAGELMPGMRLPPVRSLARQLDINSMTVAKSYKELAEAGFVESRAGGGTHVRLLNGENRNPATKRSEEPLQQPLLSERLYELSHAPGVIAFTANFPSVERSCVDELKLCIQTAMSSDTASLLGYSPPTGRIGLRQRISEYLAEQGVIANPDNVIVTSGAQQAIDLVVRCLVPPGATAVIERPAYYGVINSLRAVQARILEVPVEDDGMDVDKLEDCLVRHRPRLIYTNPTFQNPTGVSATEEKRRAVLSLARRFGVAILEDDHSSELRFNGLPIPAIRALAEPDDAVFYVRGFGKVFLPGTRLGYAVVPLAARRQLLMMKAHADLHTNLIMQEAASIFIARRNYVGILERMRNVYSARQRRLIAKLIRGMPPGTRIGQPDGGLSLWLTLPDGMEVSDLYYRAVRRGVAFIAGEVFYASRSNPRTLRVSFGSVSDEGLDEGVHRLCSAVSDLMGPRMAPSPIFT